MQVTNFTKGENFFCKNQFRIACQDCQAGKVPFSVFLKDTTEWREHVLIRDHVNHNHGALNHFTMLSTTLKVTWKTNNLLVKN